MEENIVKNLIDNMSSTLHNIQLITDTNKQLFFTPDSVPKSASLRFFDSSNLVICVNERISHILFYGCTNITIIVSKGLISGRIDILHSNNIRVILRSKHDVIFNDDGIPSCAYYVDLSNSSNISVYIERKNLQIFHIMAMNSIMNEIIGFDLMNPDSLQIDNNIIIRSRNKLNYHYFNNNYYYVLNQGILECYDSFKRIISEFNRII